MRTTLTLDPDVVEALKELMELQKKPFKQVVNELLRRGMSPEPTRDADHKAFQVKPHRGGFKPGIDLLKLNQLADKLAIDEFLAKQTREADE